LAIFFPFYVLAEVPSNLMIKVRRSSLSTAARSILTLLQATRPSVWIPFIMTAWALMCIAMAFVKNYAGLMAVRSALGLAEGGLFPGVTF
jgi:hypothetical protein